MATTTSRRLRIAIGLAVASAAVVGIGHVLLTRSLAAASAAESSRASVVALRALTEVVEKAGGAGEPVRRALAVWKAGHPDISTIRVVAFDGLSLEASTAAADTGERAAPRRLTREEKPLFDRGQRLRSAVETNRQEGVARKEEIEVEVLPAGGLTLAAPVERDGAVVGLVEMETARPARNPVPLAGVAVLYVLGPLAAFGLLAMAAGERRPLLLGGAIVLFALTVWGFGANSTAKLERARRGSEAAIGKAVAAEAARASAAVGEAGVGAALDPAAWDADEFRQPRGLVRADGSVDEGKLGAALRAQAGSIRNAFAILGVLGLGLLLFVALGGAERLWKILVTNRAAYSYIAPAMVGMVVLVFFPFLYGIAFSFTDQTIYSTNKPLWDIWVGLSNYASILGDFRIARRAADGGLLFNYLNFYWTLFVTVAWTVLNVAIGVTVGLALALILNTKGLALRPIYRVLLILPWAMPNYITALIWKGMFHQQFGVINQVIQMFGGNPVTWFDKPFTSFLTALTTNGWLSFPFMMVVSLGALQSIPADLYEAARVEGATRWRQFRSITLPSLKPALIPAIILSVVWTFNMFNIIYLVTQGEPGGSTEILITQSYKFAFEKYKYGYAAAYSTIIFGILLLYGTLQNRLTKATEGI
ncbi:MAG TPA: sugar ABC transporter permease [Thermoanaerobaculia bacterium]|nr:sugar ABC transporter permease [Thermoanaerobaculia bacterium]